MPAPRAIDRKLAGQRIRRGESPARHGLSPRISPGPSPAAATSACAASIRPLAKANPRGSTGRGCTHSAYVTSSMRSAAKNPNGKSDVSRTHWRSTHARSGTETRSSKSAADPAETHVARPPVRVFPTRCTSIRTANASSHRRRFTKLMTSGNITPARTFPGP